MSYSFSKFCNANYVFEQIDNNIYKNKKFGSDIAFVNTDKIISLLNSDKRVMVINGIEEVSSNF